VHVYGVCWLIHGDLVEAAASHGPWLLATDSETAVKLRSRHRNIQRCTHWIEAARTSLSGRLQRPPPVGGSLRVRCTTCGGHVIYRSDRSSWRSTRADALHRGHNHDKYFMWSILFFANIFKYILVINISVLTKSNMDRRKISVAYLLYAVAGSRGS
jgi:hypothetical protein